ncbi:bifunctional diaminohydroxyphosphoribosylaminopyrimidine deaminase/5-amino-6-(5-phosphoribosylamino)uracil reductase RibD [Rhizobium sp. C4]|nr:bifunctional diaminohydroxyphosphoribosylaminopyrimidine deaminase/5-amino-6-(5-phosphoribosylamino)uracil reductase RibD [Rhizobium sp. C4]
MAEAIALGATHLGQTSTNPSVGCVIVKDGNVVGRGVTAKSGRPHAEPQALAEAGELARGATAYVTLEPCSHFGKTPPCVNALIAAGVARVVVAITDPDPRVSGNGIRILREAGIVVETGLMEEAARRGLAAYLTRQTEGRAHVTLKLAVSKDGLLGRRGEGQVRITGAQSREAVQHLRAESDAILVGIGTVLADDPELTCRLPGLEGRSPVRLVLDRDLQLPLSSKLVRTSGEVPVIAVASIGEAARDENWFARRAALQKAGVEIVEAGTLIDLLRLLAAKGLSSLMLEGGARVAQDFLYAGLVDRIWLFAGSGTVGGDGVVSPVTPDHRPGGFALVSSETIGEDRLEIFERMQ